MARRRSSRRRKGTRGSLLDVHAKDGDAALAAAWAAYTDIKWPLKVTSVAPDKDGWSKQRVFTHQTSPNERRDVVAGVQFADDAWTVWIYDMAQAVGEKRGAQVALIFDELLPKNYSRETFAGKKANRLGKARIAALARFLEGGQKATGVPGVSVGIIQGGKVVFAGGFGVRELGRKTKVDADTLYMIASNTKGLTTLLLAKPMPPAPKAPRTSYGPSFATGPGGIDSPAKDGRSIANGRPRTTPPQARRCLPRLPPRASVVGVVRAADVAGPEWAEWYRLTPQLRFAESEKLWHAYLDLGGSLDPEPDTQRAFFDRKEARPRPSHGRPGLRLVRRGGV